MQAIFKHLLTKPIFSTSLMLLIILWMLSGCSQKLMQTHDVYTLPDGFPLKYTLTNFKDKKERKLLVFLPDVLDSTSWFKSALIEKLYAMNYQVLKPEIKGADYSQQAVLDNFNDRIFSITQLVNQLASQQQIDTSLQVVVLGMGEGAYIGPKLAESLQANSFLLVNNGPTSFLTELNLILEDEANSAKAAYILRFSGMYADALKAYIEAIKVGQPNTERLFNKSNGAWQSYEQNPLALSLYENKIRGIQLYETDYPFVADSVSNRFTYITHNRWPKIPVLYLQQPLLSRKPLQDSLWQQLKPYFTPR